jgi:uncharacterized protein YndB with AHSA1/START domain
MRDHGRRGRDSFARGAGRSRVAPLLAAALLAAPGALSGARAEVGDSAPNGFTVRATVEVSSAPEKVYAAFVDELGSWWDPAHTFFRDAGRLSIQARPGGCFCEAGEAQEAVEHLRVVYVDPGKLLRLRGGLGPLQGEAVEGAMTISFRPAGAEGTATVELVYRVGGYMEGGLDKLALPVDGVLSDLLQRLKRYVETGSPIAE